MSNQRTNEINALIEMRRGQPPLYYIGARRHYLPPTYREMWDYHEDYYKAAKADEKQIREGGSWGESLCAGQKALMRKHARK